MCMSSSLAEDNDLVVLVPNYTRGVHWNRRFLVHDVDFTPIDHLHEELHNIRAFGMNRGEITRVLSRNAIEAVLAPKETNYLALAGHFCKTNSS